MVNINHPKLESFIESLPEPLRQEAWSAIKEEHDRWERGDLTQKEKEMVDWVDVFFVLIMAFVLGMIAALTYF